LEVFVHRAVTVATFVLGALSAAACGSGGDGAGSVTSSGGAGSGVGGTGVVVGQGGMALGFGGSFGAGAATGAGGFDPGQACAATSIEGERVPVDLYFMVDITGSMNCPVPDSASSPCEVEPPKPFAETTRWVVESKALKAFMDSPNNHGLSVGIGFFPTANNMCDSKSYVTPKVEIGALPGAAAALNAAISAQRPAGNTPTVASLTGALDHAMAWAKSHSSHRVGVVYATDGYPRGCDLSVNTMANAAKVAKAAFDSSGVVTYVLGVGRNLSSLNQIAVAGGTESAYLIETGDDAASALAAALDNIRTRSQFGCTYEVPPPPAGQEIDYTKVNVQFTSGGGQVKALLKDPSASGCTEGWQYSADRTQVNICGAACDAVKADPAGKLQILFGCQTKVDIPK
jgi:hypothetical protein